MSIANWYLALFSVGVGVTLPGYWLVGIEKTDPFHFTSEVMTGLLLLVAGVAMFAAHEHDAWVIVLSCIGMGMLAYAMIDAPGRYRGDPKKQRLFAVSWLFLLPALVLRFTTL
ncbi:MAG: hypothetical protein ABR600_12815 [Actinomycetota bacterium]